MKISCITTQSDWASLFGNRGFPGVKFILDRCKTAGMKKVYWRVTDGGRLESACAGIDQENRGLLQEKPEVIRRHRPLPQLLCLGHKTQGAAERRAGCF